MGDDTEKVQAIIAPLLPGADEAILEYLSALIAEEEGGPTRDLEEEVVDYLLSAGIDGVDDDDAGKALCAKMQEQLRAAFGGSAPEEAPAGNKGPSMLKGPIDLQKATEITSKVGWGDVFGTSDAKSAYNSTWSTKDAGDEKAKAKKDKRAALKTMKLRERPQAESQGGQLTTMLMPSYEDASSGNRDIQVDNVTIYTPAGTSLLEDAKLKLTYGRRYGLIGKNGIGKTTLLKAMAAQDIDGFPKHLRCLHVSQECGSSSLRVVDAVIQADIELQTLLEMEQDLMDRLNVAGDEAAKEGDAASKADKGGDAASKCDAAEDTARLQEVQERLDEIEARTADSRARALLAGLQFTEEMQAGPLCNLSGGWRVRAAIAAALFIKPEVLMLDEPTNHLDLEAVLWLENHLQSYPHTILVVSHDRTFLNEVVTDIMAVENKQLKLYKGDYNSFEKNRKEQLVNQIKEYDKYIAERKHMQEFVDSFRYNAARASLVQSRIKAIEKLEAEAPPEPLDAVPFTFSIPSPDSAPGRALIQLEGCGFAYPPRDEAPVRTIFSGADFSIDSGEKICIVGPNGAGKSTMLKILLAELDPSTGSCRRKPGVSVASFTQHHVDKLDLNLSPIDNLMRTFPATLEAAARSWIGGYGIQGDMQTTPCRKMSGGQKSRVAFAMLAYARPNLIVMDEPTNHLDLETVDALIEALRSFTGGVVVVTHDQHFVERVCKELWLVCGGKVTKLKGVFQDYKKQVIKDLKL